MTKPGMSYDAWRAQFGNPLGLTHDMASHALVAKHTHLIAEDGMKGAGGEAGRTFPKVPINTPMTRADKGGPLGETLEIFDLYFGLTPEDEHYYLSDVGTPRRVLPKDRDPQLSYYYRNREKIIAYQAAYRERKRNAKEG